MLGLVWCVLGMGVICLGGCGPVIPVDEETNGEEPCIDRQPGIEIVTVTDTGQRVTAEVRWGIGDAYPGTLAHFDGSKYAIWGVAGERVKITATDGVCDFEAEVIGVSGCGDDPPARIEFVFDRFCGTPPSTTGGAPEPESGSTTGEWGTTTWGSSSSSEDGGGGAITSGSTGGIGSTTAETAATESDAASTGGEATATTGA